MLTGRSNKYQNSLHTEVGFFCRLQKRQKNESVGAVIREKCTEYLFLLDTINSIQEGIVGNDMRRGGSNSTRKSPVPADRAPWGLWHSMSAPGFAAHSQHPPLSPGAWGSWLPLYHMSKSDHSWVPHFELKVQLRFSLPQQCSGERVYR